MKLLNYPILTLLLLLCVQEAQAQQDAHYTHYMYNGLVLNPAYAGSRGVPSATAYYRYQWVGMQEPPRTISLSVHGPVSERVGLGLWIENDRLGLHNRTTVNASYAYNFPVSYGRMFIGLQAGLQRYASNWSDAQLIDIDDEVFLEDEARTLPNFGVGLYYVLSKFYIGFSVPHLLQSDISPTKLSSHDRHYFLTAGGVIPLGSTDFVLQPSILLKSVPSKAPISADFNVNFLYQNKFWIGASYRLTDSVDFLLGYKWNNKMRIGYAYDFTVSELNNHTSGSHEVFIGYDFYKDENPIVSPRIF